MYRVGDLVVYGNMGVCQVTDITVPNYDAQKRTHYVLEPLRQRCTITAPVESDKVFMRPILTRAAALELLDGIPTLTAEGVHLAAPRELAARYEASIQSHDCADLLRLTMSIYSKKQDATAKKRRFGAVDERFLRRAEALLFDELSAALDVPFEEMPAYIAARVEKALGQKA